MQILTIIGILIPIDIIMKNNHSRFQLANLLQKNPIGLIIVLLMLVGIFFYLRHSNAEKSIQSPNEEQATPIYKRREGNALPSENSDDNVTPSSLQYNEVSQPTLTSVPSMGTKTTQPLECSSGFVRVCEAGVCDCQPGSGQ